MDEVIEKYMRQLKLGGLAKDWRSVEYVSKEQYLKELLEVELHEREVNRINRIVKTAGFRVIKTLEDFVWTPTVKLPQGITQEDLENFTFVSRKENLIMLGAVGTGKTHLATAVTLRACQNELCRVLMVSRSGYYYWISEGRPRRQNKDAVMLAIIRQVERENDSNYGVRRIYRSLNGELHIKCGCSQVQRIMHENGIKAEIKSKYKPQTTKADPNDQVFPNLLNQQFSVTEFNKVWLADITYIRVNSKWNYLAAVMDLGRRKIVGWALGTSPNANLACKALKQALLKEQPGFGLIHHSDRGSQYTSKAYRLLLEKNQITGSMSRKGVPYDNAPMESFFQTLKTEYVYKRYFQTIEQADSDLRQWIDIYYNCRRLHSALGYKSPLFYEISRIHPFIVSA